MHKNSKGFTLIELLVVVAIIGILAALIVPALTRTNSPNKKANCKNNLRQIVMACLYYAENNKGMLPADGATWEESTVAGSFDLLRKHEKLNPGIFICPAYGKIDSYGYYPCLNDEMGGDVVLVADNPTEDPDKPSSNHSGKGINYAWFNGTTNWWEKPPKDSTEDPSPNVIRLCPIWIIPKVADIIDHIYRADPDVVDEEHRGEDSRVKRNYDTEE